MRGCRSKALQYAFQVFLDKRATLEIGWLVRFAGATILPLSTRSREPASIARIGVCQLHPQSEDEEAQASAARLYLAHEVELSCTEPTVRAFWHLRLPSLEKLLLLAASQGREAGPLDPQAQQMSLHLSVHSQRIHALHHAGCCWPGLAHGHGRQLARRQHQHSMHVLEVDQIWLQCQGVTGT